MSRILSIILFSVIEVIGLGGWLALVDRGLRVVGAVVLNIALALEHVVTDNVIHRRPLFNFRDLPLGQIVAFSTLETVIWATWLYLWGIDRILATLFLSVALQLEHTISKNVHERRGLFDRFVDVAVVPHTIVETIACTVWLVLVRSAQAIAGIGVLFVGSILEHTIAIRRTDV